MLISFKRRWKLNTKVWSQVFSFVSSCASETHTPNRATKKKRDDGEEGCMYVLFFLDSRRIVRIHASSVGQSNDCVLSHNV